MKPFIKLVLLLLIVGTVALAQTGSLSGFIYNDANGESLIGVNVYLPDLGVGTASNTSGYYIIPGITPGTHIVVYEYVGFRTETVNVTISASEAKSVDQFMSLETIQGEAVEVVADSVRTSIKLYSKPISNIQLNTRQINSIPQIAEADLLRSLQTLPGILPVSDFSSALYIRGGTPDQNLYLLDGTDVYNPEHAFGIFSTFNTDAIKHVDISKGGFGASRGGRLSSILDIINLDGNREEFEGSASVSLLSAKTTLQMPIGGMGAVSGSIRRTYFDQTVAKAIDEIPDYYFYDGNIKAFIELDPKNKITFSAYGGRDVLNLIFNENSSNQAGLNLDWGNETGSVRWTRVFNPQLFANFWVTGSRFSSNFDLGETVPVTEKNIVTDITVKGDLEYHYSQKLHTKFGFEQKNLNAIYEESFPDGEVLVDKDAQHFVGYLQANWRPTPNWDIQGGLRYNYFASEKNFQDLGPRLSAKYRLNETMNVKIATGIYHQYLHRIKRTFATDIWTASNQYQDESTAYHYIAGFQQEISDDVELEIEAFYKEYRNIHSFDLNFITEIQPDGFNANDDPVYSETEYIFNTGDGESYGVEVMLRKDVGPFTGWIGYSLAATEYIFDNINDGNAFHPRHDRRSTINLVGNVDVRNTWRVLKGNLPHRDNNTWKLGVNFVYSSGQPITLVGSGYLGWEGPADPEPSVELYPGATNSYRLPAYARLDLSLAYSKRYRSWSMEPYIQVFNVGNRKNVWYIDYNYENGISEIETQNMFPILPTLGINFQF